MTRPSRNALFSNCLLALILLAETVHPAAKQGRIIGRAPGALLGVDFNAVTADGQPVTDSKATEVTLQVDGKPRTLKSLEFIDLAGTPAVASAKAAPALPAPFGSNAGGGVKGRQVYLVVENETLAAGREQSTRDAITQFLDRMTPNDRVGLVTVPHGGVTIELTSDFQTIRAALPKIPGMYTSGEKAVDAACRARDTLTALQGMMNGRAGSDSPIDFVLFSSKMSAIKTSGQINIRSLASAEGGTACELKSEDFEKVRVAISAAHAHMYVVQPEEGAYFNSSDSTDNPTMGLDNLTGVTNGVKFTLATSGGALNRIARETSGYYVATYEPDATERNGAPHKLDIKVSRSDVAVRTAPMVVVDKADAVGAKPAAPAPKDMLLNSTVYGDLPIRMGAFVSRISADPKETKVKITSVTEPVDPDVKLASAAVGVFDGAKRIAQWTANAGELAKWPLFASFPVPAGSYRVRVATVDSTGRAGSADYMVDAALAAVKPATGEPAPGGIKLSGLVFGTGTGATFKPQLQFTNEPTATAFFELYGGLAGMGITALDVEIAATEDGPKLGKFEPAVSGSSEPDWFIFIAPIAIGALSPGDYVVRITLEIADKGKVRITRTLRKVGQ